MNDEQAGRVLQQLETLQASVNEIKRRLEDDYVTQDEYQPISRIVQAMVALILAGFFAAMTALVYNRGVVHEQPAGTPIRSETNQR